MERDMMNLLINHCTKDHDKIKESKLCLKIYRKESE